MFNSPWNFEAPTSRDSEDFASTGGAWHPDSQRIGVPGILSGSALREGHLEGKSALGPLYRFWDSLLLFGGKPITHATNGVKVERIAGVLLEVLAEAVNKGIESPGRGVKGVAPNPLE